MERGARVRVEHYGFDELGSDHRVWHGEDRESFIGSMGLWWGDLLAALRVASSRQQYWTPLLTTAMHRQVQAQPTEGSSREGIRELRCLSY